MSAAEQKLQKTIKQLEKSLSEKDKIISQKNQLIAAFEEYIRLQKARLFGKSSEKSPDQKEMFNEAELTAFAEEMLVEIEQEEVDTASNPEEAKKPVIKPRRKPLPEDLPRIRIEHDKLSKADMAIIMIKKLYAIEKRMEGSDTETKYRVRQKESVPQLDKIREWLDNNLQGVLPKGLLGKALSYMEKNWSKLTVYTEEGRLNIDNNPAENAIRPFVVGRKNWLISTSVQGAKSSANLYSLIETAKANDLEPYYYLRRVFAELQKATSVEDVEALLPWNVSLQDGVCRALT